MALVPPVADAVTWLFEPRYYFTEASAGTYSTPEDAIRAFADDKNWRDRGWNYEGDCDDAIQGEPRRLLCSTAWRGGGAWIERQVRPGEHAYFVGPGWSDGFYASRSRSSSARKLAGS